VAASKQLKNFRAQFWDLSLGHAGATACDATRRATDVANTKAALLQAKKLSQQQLPVAVMSALTFCVASRLQLRDVYSRLHALQLQPVTQHDAWCAPRLQALQQLGASAAAAASGDGVDGSSAWAALGFQGKDPCTDFRGSGRLGLECLHVMCGSMCDTLPLLLQQSHNPSTAYPFACAVINVVHRSLAALRLGQLDAAMRCGGYEDQAFHAVVASAVGRCARHAVRVNL